MHIAHTLTHSHTLTHIAHTYTYMYVPHTHIHMCTHTHTHTQHPGSAGELPSVSVGRLPRLCRCLASIAYVNNNINIALT